MNLLINVLICGLLLMGPDDPMMDGVTPDMVVCSAEATATYSDMISGPLPLDAPTADAQGAAGIVFGVPGAIQCYNCTPFSIKVRLTHYNPTQGEINCWLYDDNLDWCMSDMASGLPWEAFWGYAAACPPEWPMGTWVDVPGVGAFVCMDRGGMVTCDPATGVCAVDILGPSGPWDGQTFDVILWVPLRPGG